tara:strand:+ start:697 stop:912 length:216 start_codon:yes stop_codon:yes gene_type:complete
MSKLYEEASAILGLERDLTLDDYKRFTEIRRNIPDSEETRFAWLGEGLHIRLSEIASKEGNYDWLEPEDDD